MPKNKKSLIFVIFRASTYNIEIEDFVLYGMTGYLSQTMENQRLAIPIAIGTPTRIGTTLLSDDTPGCLENIIQNFFTNHLTFEIIVINFETITQLFN